ncbi:MAG: phosphate regulon sensor protein PhoR [Ostreibacterium sp.]
MINKHPWKTEVFKLLVAGLCCLVLFDLTNQWVFAISVTLIGYFLRFMFKLYEVLRWLQHDISDKLMPEANGVLGSIIGLVYQRKKYLEGCHEQQKSMAQQFHEAILAIPSATIILSQENEIEWANYPALLLLGVNGQRDIGVKIDGLIRQTDFVRHLTHHTGEPFEIISPIDDSIILSVQVVQYAQFRKLLIAHHITSHIEVQRSRKLFIANASHELRTPLTVIAGYLEFIASDSNLPDTCQIPVKQAIEQSKNIQVLINDLLVLSKLENCELESHHITRIDLATHLATILQTLVASGKTDKYSIRSSVDEKLWIEASEKELNSVCYNLINNAVKYSESGSKLYIFWRKLPNEQVIFSVRDQGIGIAPEHITHLTERFYRVDNGRSRRVGGTGLGLSIVKHIVERHNGRMEIDSRLGEGSIFSIILPINPLKK